MFLINDFTSNRDKKFFRLCKCLMIIALAAQVFFWFKAESIKPNLEIVANPPSKAVLEVNSLGDKEFYFRTQALRIQNMGDTFGRFSALKDYDYKKLYHWFKLMDTLDNRSNFVPAIVSYYFSNTPEAEDTRYLIKYLREHAAQNPEKKWWWLYQATYIANRTLEDKDLAVEIALEMRDTSGPDAPLWTKNFAAFLYEDMGDACQSYFIIKQILDDYDAGKQKAKEYEIEFMGQFIKERLSRLKEGNFDPRDCYKKENN